MIVINIVIIIGSIIEYLLHSTDSYMTCSATKLVWYLGEEKKTFISHAIIDTIRVFLKNNGKGRFTYYDPFGSSGFLHHCFCKVKRNVLLVLEH